ncbi:MAG: L-serine ammonia-lyase, iron-sulfur-dependent, subunit alpha [Elusimicrobiota bacterium]|nr:L-serine ammonia-lyase, iron-sulfur-dependent, subunit alpha [Elusimicrobiota bacterium]
MNTNLLKEVLKHQVYPAMGCTEPVSVALCAATAAAQAKGKIVKAAFYADAGTFKNGLGVRIPNTNGEKGNLLAAAVGLLTAKPELGMEILSACTPAILKRAKAMIAKKAVQIKVISKKGFYIEANIETDKKENIKCIISGSHTSVALLEKNGKILKESKNISKKDCAAFKIKLAKTSLKNLIKEAQKADKKDLQYIKKGALMNLAASASAGKLKKVGFYLEKLVENDMLDNNIVNSSKILAARAADARMDGLPIPVMSSGESGNQGIVAILVPYHVGKKNKVKEKIILQSIALSHLLNGYVKCFTGGLSPICGCAIAAGVGAAAALVYQKNGPDIKGITLAINNIISDIGGMLCDGAKSGCALKVASSVDSALRAAFMGIRHYGITETEGFVGRTAEETIQNLSRISNIGMNAVDSCIVGIMQDKIS